MKVVVTGSRKYTDSRIVAAALKAAGATMVIEGGAIGADRIAGDWARSQGIPNVRIDALWTYYDKSAGPIRNGWLLDLEPDLVLAFPLPDSRGTWDCVRQAKERGIEVEVIDT